MNEKKCKHIKTDGSKCQAWKLKDEDYCYFHSPGKAAERDLARSQGGKGKAVLSQEVLIAELIEELPQGGIVQGENGKTKLQINTLDDLQQFAEKQISYIEDNKQYLKLSQADRVMMVRWSDFLLKLMVLRGLDVESRLRELEVLADSIEK